jgi:hypothetical protein
MPGRLIPPNPSYIAPLTPEHLLRFAPKVTFHPSERHFPCSIEWMLSDAVLRRRSDPNFLRELKGDPNLLGDGDPANGEDYYVDINPSRYHGFQPDQYGRIHAPMYVAVQFLGPFIDINYFFLYAFQSSQPINVMNPLKNFRCTAHDFARHAGDLETITVRVFATRPDVICAVGYEQHGTKHWYGVGEFESEGDRPVVRAALNLHPSYNGQGYNQSGDDWHILAEDDFLDIVDVIRRDSGAVWAPHEDSELVLIGRDDKTGQPLTDAKWVTFTGRFGTKWQNSLTKVTALDNGPLEGWQAAQVAAMTTIAEILGKLPSSEDLLVGNGPGAFGSRGNVRLRRPIGQYHFIQSRLDPRLVLTYNSATNPESLVVEHLAMLGSRDNQLWRMDDWEDRGFSLVNKATQTRVAMLNGEEKPIAMTGGGPGFGDDKWRWRVEADNGDGFRALRTHWSTRQYADITGNKSEAGTVVQASVWHLGLNQQWRFVPDQLYNIRSPINRDFALAGLPDRSLRMKRCTAAQAYTDPSVQWRLHRFTTGFLLIHPALSLIACVRLDDVKAGIRLHELDGGGPVRPGEWTLGRIAGDDRIYEVRLVFSQKRMLWDAYNAVIAEGTELWSHESNNGANQKWVFTINGNDGTVEPAF